MTLNSSTVHYEQTMTQTPIDPLTDQWMDNIQAENNVPPSLNTLKKMTAKKTTALATRSIDSFKLFQAKEFVSGYQNLVTIQPLNKSKTRGWFVRKSDLDVCDWSAAEDQFAKGSVIWNYKLLVWHLILQLKKDLILLNLVCKFFCVHRSWWKKPWVCAR
jgi:hypothetical protein